jgi:hypothetical protein
MGNLLVLAATLLGYAGALICLITGLSRIAGQHYLYGYQSTTLFTAGMALMVFAVLLKLDAGGNR